VSKESGDGGERMEQEKRRPRVKEEREKEEEGERREKGGTFLEKGLFARSRLDTPWKASGGMAETCSLHRFSCSLCTLAWPCVVEDRLARLQ
jgi:hypothetical protein